MIEEVLLAETRICLVDRHHAPAFFAMIETDREFFRPWIPFVPSLRSLADAEEKIVGYKRLYGQGEAYVWGLFSGSRMIGLVLLMGIDHRRGCGELGYMLAMDYCGQGLATAACRRVMDFAFGPLGLGRLSLSCDPRNEPSLALARRLGFEHEGTLRREALVDGALRDSAVFGLLREEYGVSREG